MAKGVKIDTVSRVLETSRRAGIWNHAFWIFGYPGETEEELLRTIDFIIANAERIHSHAYHAYCDVGAIGTGHRDIREYVGSLKRQFSRCSDSFVRHRKVARKLFRIEREIAFRPENHANPWCCGADDGELEENRRLVRRSARLRELIMRTLRAYLVQPEIRVMLERHLTVETFLRLHSGLEHDGTKWWAQESPAFAAALAARLNGESSR